MLRCFYLFIFLTTATLSANTAYLRDNLNKAKPGDFIVAAQNKNYTLLHIFNRKGNHLIIEEITVPAARLNLKQTSWREWVYRGAPCNTSWILYTIDLNTAKPHQYYSVTKGCWFEMPERENFLATLLNLKLEQLTHKERKKVGVPILPTAESKQVWNPKLVVDGDVVPDAAFDAWRTKWPQDGSEVAGKTIEIYTPQDSQYTSYFPYWLQISGVVGNAKIRIIDSGSRLLSPAPQVFDLAP